MLLSRDEHWYINITEVSLLTCSETFSYMMSNNVFLRQSYHALNRTSCI